MTQGKPLKNLIIFSIPLIIGNFAQQLYSTVDSIIVGKFIGDNALSAVGSTGPVVNIMLILFVGISVGVSVLVSQYFGARDSDNLSFTIGNCITLTFLSSVIIAIIGILLARPLLELLNTPASIIEWSYQYIVICLIGGVGLAYFNILSGVLRGLGDSVSALKYLIVATFVNIILDLVFVIFFNLEVVGVALATIIAQIISAILAYRRIHKLSHLFTLDKHHLMFHKETIFRIFKIGLPAGVAQAIMSVAMLTTQSLTNSFGEQYIAANIIIMRVDAFTVMPIFSIANALTTFAGQNTGAKNFELLKKGASQGIKLNLGISISCSIIILLFGKSLMSMFTDTQNLIDISYNYMCVLIVGYVCFSISQSIGGIIRGTGDSVTPMWISIMSTVVRVPIAYFIAYITISDTFVSGNPISLYISLLIAWGLGALISLIIYKKNKWLIS